MKDYTVPDSEGMLITIYGPTGVGKSTSTYATLPGRTLVVLSEKRNPKRSLDAIEKYYGKKPQIKFIIPEGWEDLMEFLAGEVTKDKLPYQNLVIDSFSHFLNVLMKWEAEQESANVGYIKSKVGDKIAPRPFVDQFRLDQTAYGSLASASVRLCNMLGELSLKGIIVVCTALRDENPNWSYSLNEAPAFLGKAFPINMPAFFDLIGRVRPRIKKDDDGKTEIVYPPIVDFESDGTFLAKWTGKRGKTTSGPLDFQAILGIKQKGGK